MAIMYDGRVQQVGSADELYERPANHFVADFLGKMNFHEGRLVADGLKPAMAPDPHRFKRMPMRRHWASAQSASC